MNSLSRIFYVKLPKINDPQKLYSLDTNAAGVQAFVWISTVDALIVRWLDNFRQFEDQRSEQLSESWTTDPI